LGLLIVGSRAGGTAILRHGEGATRNPRTLKFAACGTQKRSKVNLTAIPVWICSSWMDCSSFGFAFNHLAE